MDGGTTALEFIIAVLVVAVVLVAPLTANPIFVGIPGPLGFIPIGGPHPLVGGISASFVPRTGPMQTLRATVGVYGIRHAAVADTRNYLGA
jgi:hypothetical protein